mmetsp:Transcript_96013/g.298992  ORF Transcript_96013/g.298992 Transcript_96013/m.298992 type:complete len:515 (-) Transcript_96013:6-1550(-)
MQVGKERHVHEQADLPLGAWERDGVLCKPAVEAPRKAHLEVAGEADGQAHGVLPGAVPHESAAPMDHLQHVAEDRRPEQQKGAGEEEGVRKHPLVDARGALDLVGHMAVLAIAAQVVHRRPEEGGEDGEEAVRQLEARRAAEVRGEAVLDVVAHVGLEGGDRVSAVCLAEELRDVLLDPLAIGLHGAPGLAQGVRAQLPHHEVVVLQLLPKAEVHADARRRVGQSRGETDSHGEGDKYGEVRRQLMLRCPLARHGDEDHGVAKDQGTEAVAEHGRDDPRCQPERHEVDALGATVRGDECRQLVIAPKPCEVARVPQHDHALGVGDDFWQRRDAVGFEIRAALMNAEFVEPPALVHPGAHDVAKEDEDQVHGYRCPLDRHDKARIAAEGLVVAVAPDHNGERRAQDPRGHRGRQSDARVEVVEQCQRLEPAPCGPHVGDHHVEPICCHLGGEEQLVALEVVPQGSLLGRAAMGAPRGDLARQDAAENESEACQHVAAANGPDGLVIIGEHLHGCD